VYRYDDLGAAEEEETELTGEIEVPRLGDILFRKNQAWKVVGIYPGYGSDIQRVRVLLMDASTPHFLN